MTIKKCSGCGRELPDSEFNKNRNSEDGLQDRCRKCFSEYNRNRYANDPEKTKERVREYRAANAENVLVTRLGMCERNPNHKNANEAVALALSCGVLHRPHRCQGCGCDESEHRIEAHHADYSKPLDVIWLCTPCHREMDARRRVSEGNDPYGKRG